MKIRQRSSRAMTEMTNLPLGWRNEEKMDCNEETSLCHVENQGGSHLSLDNENILDMSIDEAIGMYFSNTCVYSSYCMA